MSKLPDTHKVVTGHRPHMTGSGRHDPRPRRKRTRGDAKRASIDAQRDES